MQVKGNISIKELSEYTFIKIDDIITTLSSLNLIRYWKGQYVITNFSTKLIEDHFKKKDEQNKKNGRVPIKFISELIIN